MIDVKTKFVSVVVFTVEPEDVPGFAREASLALQRTAPIHSGFVEGIVMANDQRTQVLVISQWASRHDWSIAQWDEDIGHTLSDLVEGASKFDVHGYEPITVVRGR